MKQAVTKTTIVRYLLGRLPDEERKELTDRYFEDDDLFADILAVKDELLDNYRHGALAPEDKVAFEEFLSKYPLAEHELALVQALNNYTRRHPEEIDAIEVAPAQNPVRVISSHPSVPQKRRVSFAVAAMAAVAVFGVMTWLVVNNRRLAIDNQRVNDHLTEFKKEAADIQERLRNDIDRERKEKAALQGQLRSPILIASEIYAFAFRLSEDRQAVEPRPITLSPQKIRFEGNVKADDDFNRYEALIQRQDNGDVVWPLRTLPLRRVGDDILLSFEAPAALFKDNQVYKLTVIGAGENQNSKELGYQYFKVIKR
jgi:hypothetical protein